MEWKTAKTLVEYPVALETMERRVDDIIAGNAPELAWLLEHPPLYTAGTSAKPGDLFKNAPFPTYETGRGGEWTYHGPGQRVCYLMLDLKKRNLADMHAYVRKLEQWIIATLKEFGVEGFTREGRVGVWVSRPPLEGGQNFRKEIRGGYERTFGTPPDSLRESAPPQGGGKKEYKIAALGVRVKKWVTYHGISLNVAPDLSHYAGIVPCGIKDHGVTSLKALGMDVSAGDVDAALKKNFTEIF